jgi:predicted lipid-binding transport protein (Tim44 family)
MIYPGFGRGGGFGPIVSLIASGIVAVLFFLVAVGLLFLLVRFLLVGTRAAQLYIARHEPPRPVAPQPGPDFAAPSGSAPNSPAPTETAPAAPTAPAATPRTRKTPPAS